MGILVSRCEEIRFFMPSITFELETVTPLFLAGADQTEAELRPPAFRGALRYWFRAMPRAFGYAENAKNHKWVRFNINNAMFISVVDSAISLEQVPNIINRKKYREQKREFLTTFTKFEIDLLRMKLCF